MWGKLLPVIAVTAALADLARAFAGDQNGAGSQFITKDFINLRHGPGTNWPLLDVIPPSTQVEVDHWSTCWSVGWCQVSYDGQTGSARNSLLQPLPRPFSKAQGSARKPKFLIQAEKNYNQARKAVRSAQDSLDHLRRTEAQQSQTAMVKTGSWIEPKALWQRKRAMEQNLAFAREQESQARAALDNAEDHARSISEANWSRSHQPVRPSWWQWW